MRNLQQLLAVLYVSLSLSLSLISSRPAGVSLIPRYSNIQSSIRIYCRGVSDEVVEAGGMPSDSGIKRP